jgi:hypothetical protein
MVVDRSRFSDPVHQIRLGEKLLTFVVRKNKNVPVQVSLAGRFGFGRKIWLSPVIQATWEARTVEWLEVEGNGRMLGSALGASTLTVALMFPPRSL